MNMRTDPLVQPHVRQSGKLLNLTAISIFRSLPDRESALITLIREWTRPEK